MIGARIWQTPEVLVVAEHRQEEMSAVTAELVGAGVALGGRVTVAVIAREPQRYVDAVDLVGVSEIITVPVSDEDFTSDTYRQALGTLIDRNQPRLILLGFTVNSASYGPAVAATRNIAFASDVIAFSVEADELVARRPFYGGKVEGEIDFPGAPQVMLLLRSGLWPIDTRAGEAVVSELSLDFDRSRTRRRHWIEPEPSGDVDITSVDFLLSIGRGIGESEHIPTLQRLADQLGATLCASRPLIDAGWMPPSRQVGQSGKSVSPKVYLALGVSGAVQHLAGMRTSNTIIAVNLDPEAPILGIAHYAAIADLFEVAEALSHGDQ